MWWKQHDWRGAPNTLLDVLITGWSVQQCVGEEDPLKSQIMHIMYIQSLTGGFDRARRGKWMMHSKLEVWEKKTQLPEAIQRWMHQLCNYCTCSICIQNFPLCLHLSFAIYSLFPSQDWPGGYISHQDCPPQLLCTTSLGVLEHFFQQRVQTLHCRDCRNCIDWIMSGGVWWCLMHVWWCQCI